MIAAVEHDENLLVSKKSNQSGGWVLGANGEPKHERQRAGHKQRVGKGSKINEPNSISVGRDQSMGNGQGDGGLAASTRSDDCDEAPQRPS